MRTPLTKVFLAILVLLLALAVELRFLASLGWAFDFFLLAIIIPAFFLDTIELIFFGVFTAFLSRLIYPFGSGEMLALLAIPFAVFILKKVLLWQSWFEPLLAAIFGILGFYALARAPMFANGIGFFAANIVVSFAFAWGLYGFFGKLNNDGR